MTAVTSKTYGVKCIGPGCKKGECECILYKKQKQKKVEQIIEHTIGEDLETQKKRQAYLRKAPTHKAFKERNVTNPFDSQATTSASKVLFDTMKEKLQATLLEDLTKDIQNNISEQRERQQANELAGINKKREHTENLARSSTVPTSLSSSSSSSHSSSSKSKAATPEQIVEKQKAMEESLNENPPPPYQSKKEQLTEITSELLNSLNERIRNQRLSIMMLKEIKAPLETITEAENKLQEIETQKEEIKKGSGRDNYRGTYDNEIEQVMKNEPGWSGVISSDEIGSLPPKKFQNFIMNLSPRSSVGSHWIAVLIDADEKGDGEIDYFDPLGDPASEQFKHDIQKLIERINPTYLLKFKENLVPNQDRSSNCGWHSMNFIMKRLNGESFAEATGYKEYKQKSNVREAEKEANELKEQNGFGYL